MQTTSGDAINYLATGGTTGAGNDAVLNVILGGTITGHNNGIVVSQQGVGDVNITTAGDVTGLAGSGIKAIISPPSGRGAITINTGNVTGTGTGSIGIDAEIETRARAMSP